MLKGSIRLFVICGFLAFAAYAYVESENDMERIAEENGFDAEQTSAYRACDRDMSGKSLTVGDSTYSPVPDEICVCHSREMVAVFGSGQYSSHQNVVDYLVDETDDRPLNQSHLRNPASADGDFRRLADSLRRCVAFYQIENDRRNREALRRLCKEMEGRTNRPSQCADLASGRL